MAPRKRQPKPSPSKAAPGSDPVRDYGSYIKLAGELIPLERHATEFQVLGAVPTLTTAHKAASVSSTVTRMKVDAKDRDRGMDEVRSASALASHVYIRPDTGEELTFTKRVIVKLTHNDPALLEQLAAAYQLTPVGKQGDEHVLQLSAAATENPLKIANRIAELPGVEYAQPEQWVVMQMHAAGTLFSRQWYLSAALTTDPDLSPTAGIDCPGAWAITRGTPSIVVAVIDDGFQLRHPAFKGKSIHPAVRDFAEADFNPNPRAGNYHGTPVASIATGSDQGGAMSGIAPACTFLPIRISFGGPSAPFDILDVFRHASRYADVVNCSFGYPPSSMPVLSPGFHQEITALTQTGGRRGKGLVMVFSAANDDVPTYLPAQENVNGIRFTRRNSFDGLEGAFIPPGKPVYTGYPMVPGVIVVGASTSLKRKSGYSNWGTHITVVAPSNNLHYNMSFLPPTDPLRAPFVANYRGLGQVAASNRPPGSPFQKLSDDPLTPQVREDDYTASFGGTSGAAPVVTGVVALMLSANPDLTASQVRSILMATADRDLDTTLDLVADPNIIPNTVGQNLAFVNQRSLLFGSGKINARKAVEQAKALAMGPADAPSHTSSTATSSQNGSSTLLTPLTVLTPSFCVIQGRTQDGQLIVTGLSSSIDQACANTFAQVIPDAPRSPVGSCGGKSIWQIFQSA